MEIDPKTFKYWMAVIADRTGRALSPPTYAEYHRVLSGELSTEQFVEAARLVFRNAEFWPAPRLFIDAVKPDPRLEAANMFDQLRAMYHPGLHGNWWVADDIERELGHATLVAFRAIGGAERLNSMTGNDGAFARKDFVEAYISAKVDAAKPPRDAMLLQSGRHQLTPG